MGNDKVLNMNEVLNMSYTKNKVAAPYVDDVRSYMFEIETKEVLHIDRMGADDIARAIEELAVAKSIWIWADEDVLSMKLGKWKIRVMPDAVVVNAGDYVLVGDDRFVLLRAVGDGWYVPVAKGDEVTWDGTEELLRPSDIRRIAKEALKRVIEHTRWL